MPLLILTLISQSLPFAAMMRYLLTKKKIPLNMILFYFTKSLRLEEVKLTTDSKTLLPLYFTRMASA